MDDCLYSVRALLFLFSLVFFSLPCLPQATYLGGLVDEAYSEHLIHNIIEKRAESSQEPHFKVDDLIVDEFAGEVMVCVLGGSGDNRRSLAIFTGAGFEDQCPNRPCPSATENVDYVRLFETQFELKKGERFCRNISIINDRTIEGREFFIVFLEDLRWGEIIQLLPIVIEDDDSPTFLSQTQSVREDDGSVSVCVRGGITNETVAFHPRNTTDSNAIGIATAGQDYTYVYEILTLSPGQQICVDIPILDDFLYEGQGETFEVLLTAVNETHSNFSSTGTSVFIIEDDSTPQFVSRNYVASENDGVAVVCVEFDAPAGLTVESTLTTMDFTALAGQDYEHLSENFTIQGGESKCYNVAIVDDTLPEATERIRLLLNSSNNALRHQFVTELTIVDDDVLDFERSSYSVGENDASVTICVRLMSRVSPAVSARGSLVTSSTNAIVGTDYLGIDETFSLSGTSRMCFALVSINDNIPEFSETVTLTLSTLTTSGRVLEQRFAIVTIVDDDAELCDPLEPPDNGEILFFTNERKPGSLVFYGCNEGYSLSEGGLYRKCLLNGMWSNQDPTCQANMCPALSAPSSGTVQVTGLDIGSKAFYDCMRGHTLDGDQERECLLSGMWSGSEPACFEILCPDLPDIVDGMVTIVGQSVDSLAVYSCSEGFDLIGDDVRVCLENATWNGSAPICQATTDQPMPMPVDVRIVKETPKISGREVMVAFETSGPTDSVVCQLGDYSVVEDFANRDSGNMTFRDMEPGVYTLKITASNSHSGETTTIERFFELSNHPDFCGLHLINDGLVVDGSDAHVQFAGVPTHIQSFRCKLDNKPGFDCDGVVHLENIEAGTHRLKIMHNRHECGPRRKLFLHFTIE